MLTNLLVVQEERGHLKLVRNAAGAVPGGRAYEIIVGTVGMTMTGHAPTVIQGPAASG